MSDFQCDSLFSLEDEDASQLFITQTPSSKNFMDKDNDDSDENSTEIMQFGINGTDFKSLVVLLVTKMPQYSDISDEETDFRMDDSR